MGRPSKYPEFLGFLFFGLKALWGRGCPHCARRARSPRTADLMAQLLKL